MSAKELSKFDPLLSRSFFDFPTSFDWFDDFVPQRFLHRSLEPKAIKLEEFVKDGKLVIRAELPGVDPDKDIDISIHDGFLTIKGERHQEMKDEHRSEFIYGSFTRTISLPKDVDYKKITADYDNGILEVTLDMPKAVSEVKKVLVNKKSK